MSLLPLSACADLPALSDAGAVHEVVVTTTEYSFRAPDTIPAGLTRIRLFNQGKEPHHVQLARLEKGRTIAELRESLTGSDALPTWVTFVGGPNDPAPGAASEVLVSLPAGSYAMLCFIPSTDGVPHLAKGMLRPLAVVLGRLAPGKTAADVLHWLHARPGSDAR